MSRAEIVSQGHAEAPVVWSPGVALVGKRGQMPAQAAAIVAGALRIELVRLDCSADALPGAAGGPFLAPGLGERSVVVATDGGGRFLTRTIDLVLRAQGIAVVALEPTIPAAIRDALRIFCADKGYALVGAETLAPPARSAQPEPTFLVSLEERAAPGEAALVLIDVQNDFCAADGATGRSGQSMTMIHEAVARIKGLLAAAREAGLFIVHVKAEYGELYRNVGSPYRFPVGRGREPAVWTASAADLTSGDRFPPGNVEVCLPGSRGGDFVDGIVPQPGEAIVTKHRFGAFTETGLEGLLRSRGIRTVVLAGVTTNCCVETTAREAVMRDFYLVVASDCCAVKDHLADLHRATLETLGLYFGVVRSSEEIAALWAAGRRAGPRDQRDQVL